MLFLTKNNSKTFLPILNQGYKSTEERIKSIKKSLYYYKEKDYRYI